MHNVKDLELLMMHNRVFCAEVGAEGAAHWAGQGVSKESSRTFSSSSSWGAKLTTALACLLCACFAMLFGI